MKKAKYNKFGSIFFLLLLLASCTEDLGNYDYIDLKEIEFNNIESEITALSFSDLVIEPELGDINESNYLFEWKAIRRDGDMQTTIIGEEKNLNYSVKLPPALYSLVYTVREKEAEVFSRKVVELRVKSITSEGWLVLCDDNGNARLDIHSKVTDQTYFDILSPYDLGVITGPRKLQVLPNMLTDHNSPFYLFADNAATKLGRNDIEWKPEYDMSYEMGNGKKVLPTGIVYGGTSKMFISDSKAYFCDFITGDGLFGQTINKDYNIADGIGANIGAEYILAPLFLLYDDDQKKFISYNQYIAPMLTSSGMDLGLENYEMFGLVTGDAFELPMGYDFKYIENTKYDPAGSYDGMTYAILTSGANYYLYGFQMGDMYAGEAASHCIYSCNKAFYGDLSACTDIGSASHFAFSSLKNYMYYAVGDKVYRVDLSNSALSSVFQFDTAGEVISSLKFHQYYQASNLTRSYDLIVGTTEGTLSIYDGMASDGDFSATEPKEKHSDFGNIVDVIYVELVE
ncbi:PKD-like family lipoprotein [Saccharicrinis carchari]|nr:PKD-like family lipoprotein [Saccharicrinis carchari]